MIDVTNGGSFCQLYFVTFLCSTFKPICLTKTLFVGSEITTVKSVATDVVFKALSLPLTSLFVLSKNGCQLARSHLSVDLARFFLLNKLTNLKSSPESRIYKFLVINHSFLLPFVHSKNLYQLEVYFREHTFTL